MKRKTELFEGHADNQCTVCGAFRPDGKPPTVHRTGCINQDPDKMVVPDAKVVPAPKS
jgi:hypothetical protein